MDREQQVEWARRYLVDAWMSFAGEQGKGWGTSKDTGVSSSNGGGHGGKCIERNWQDLPSRILTASPHLQGISGHEEILDKLLESMPLLEALEILERELG